jgi:5-formyltetrahydrofolate cyclo-ligase
VPTDKSDLRQKLRARRRALSADEQHQAARRLAVNLTGTRLFLTSRRVACYLPNDGEIDSALVIKNIHRLRKILYLPVLSRLSHDRLWFAEAGPKTKLVPNRFGIPEPVVKSRDLVRAQELDLILMPLVGFDDRATGWAWAAAFTTAAWNSCATGTTGASHICSESRMISSASTASRPTPGTSRCKA